MKHLKPVRSLINTTILSAAALFAVMQTGARAAAFTPGNLAIEQLYTNGTSSTFSIIEVDPESGSLVQNIDIPYTGASALRQANNGSTGRLGLSNDKSLVTFTGAEDPTGVADETTILPRGVGTLDANGNYLLQASYTGVSKNQARSVATVDNVNWYFADKGGLYLKNTSTPAKAQNIRLDKSFGGVIYAVNAQNAGVIETVSSDGTTITPLPGLATVTDTAAQDFYMISSQNNGTYDIIYINDGAQIEKFSLSSGTWSLSGVVSLGFTDGSLADGLCAANNGSGGAILYGTTGTGNYVFTVTDTTGLGAAPVLASTPPTPVYTGAQAYLKGIEFVPTGAGSSLRTPPVLTNALNITVLSNSFVLTLQSGNWSTWLSSITNILVGSTNLYTTTPPFNSGITKGSTSITFDMTANPIYRIAGSLNIVISANGYSGDFVTQPIAAGPATQVLISTQPAAPTANGGTLVTNPVVFIADQYGNAANSSATTVTASPVQGTWNFGSGSGITQTIVNGVGTFTNLSATSAAAVNGATTLFTVAGSGLSQNTVSSASFNIPAPATTGFTPGNLAVFQLDTVANNSTFSILELSPTAINQPSPVNIFAITATGMNALRNTQSGTTGRVADNDDGTLVCFTGFEDGSSSTPSEAAINPRGAGTLNPFGNYVLQASYTGIGGGTANQTRSATSVDNSTWYIGDKGGTYTNNQTTPYIGGTSALNIRSVKSFGGVIYGIQQQSGSVVATLLQIVPVNGYVYPGIPSTSQSYYPVDGFPQDNEVVDFYLVKSGNNGGIYDVVYYLDDNGTAAGSINKYYYSGLDNNNVPSYTAAGSVATANGGDGLCAAVNTNGGFDIYYTTGAGGTPGNSVVQVHDSASWNQTINLTSTNTLYTVGSASSLKGLAFAPVGHVLKTSASGGKFVFQFTGTSGLTNYNVLATNNLAAPKATWPIVGAAVESPAGSGNYQFTNPAPVGVQFYMIRQP
jgi:hypothetical protein